MSVEIPMPAEPDPAELASAAAAARRRPSLWRHPDFMKLWSAQSISLLGDEMTGLAVPLIAILLLHATAFEMGVLGTLLFLPFILLTLPAGAWVDRLRRRPILIGADLGRAAILLSIPIAYPLGVLTLLQLFVAAFLVGPPARIGTAPTAPASTSASSARSRLTARRSRAGGSAAWGTPAMNGRSTSRSTISASSAGRS